MVRRRSRRTRGRVSATLASVAAVLGGALAVVLPTPAEAVQSPTSCSSTVALSNGDFEQPVFADNSGPFLPDSQVPGWYTTASDHQIEMWSNGYFGVPAGSGRQFAELNANMASTLYQDVPTTPGQTLRWQLLHRGRAGTDTMAVVIGRPNGVLASQGNLTDGKTAWGAHSGVYTVPPGQNTTRFGFQAVSTATGNNTVGNFLDGISFGTGPCVITDESVTTPSGGTTAQVGDVLTYTVSATNRGGNPANLTVMSDDLPAGVTFVPGSIRVVTGSSTTAATDAAGDDRAEYQSAGRTVTVRVGSGATASAGGAIASGEKRGFSYQVRVDATSAATTITDDATTVFTDDLAGNRSTSRSQVVSTAVAAAADLEVGLTQDTPALVAGRSVQYTATVTDHGPSAATAVRVTATVPAGLTGVTASSAGSSCTVSGTTVTCTRATLGAGAAATVTITGSVPATEAAGTQYTVTAAADSPVFDHVPGNDSASTSSSVTTSADLGVVLSSSPASPVAGQDVTYTAVVTSQGPSTARGIVLSDPVPTGSTNPRASVPGGSCSVTSTGAVECALPDLAPGGSATVTIVVTLDPGGSGAVDNVVSVSAATPDPSSGNDQASVHSSGGAVADLSVDLSISAPTAYPGDSVNWTLVVHNDGPSAATNVSFNTVVPPGMTILRPANPYCTSTACTFPSMMPGQTVTLTGTAAIETDAPAGPGTARTTVVSPTRDIDAADNTDSVAFTVLLRADLAVTRAVAGAHGSTSPVAGGDVRETITVTDAGPTRAESIVLRQSVPSGEPVPTITADAGTCSYTGSVTADGLADGGGQVECGLDVLASNASWTVWLDSRLPSSYPAPSLSRTTVVSSASPDPDASNDTSTDATTVGHRADIAVTQGTSTPAVVQTDQVRFHVTVTNAGPSDARDVLVREQPHPGVVVSSAVPVVGTYSPGSGSWRIPLLAVGATAEMDVVGTAEADGTVVNDVSYVSAQSSDPDPSDDRASASVAVTAAVRLLTIAATATAAPARPAGAQVGDALGYRYEVVNAGNVAIRDVTVVDAMAGTATCPATALAVGAAMTCTGDDPYLVTQGDVDNGHPLAGAGYARGLAPDSTDPLVFGPAADPVPLAPAVNALSVDLTADWTDADADGVLDAGEPVSWQAVVSNGGTVSVGSLQLSGVVSTGWTCSPTSVGPGQQATCRSAEHAVLGPEAGAPLTDTVTATTTSARDGSAVTGAAAVTVGRYAERVAVATPPTSGQTVPPAVGQPAPPTVGRPAPPTVGRQVPSTGVPDPSTPGSVAIPVDRGGTAATSGSSTTELGAPRAPLPGAVPVAPATSGFARALGAAGMAGGVAFLGFLFLLLLRRRRDDERETAPPLDPQVA